MLRPRIRRAPLIQTRPRSIFPVAAPLLRAAAVVMLTGVAQGCGAKARAAADSDGSAVVQALYQNHFAHEQNWDATYQRQRARFAPELAALLDADTRASAANADEIVGLDFDPLTYAQDTMTGFEVGPATRQGADAIVSVHVRQDSTRVNLRVRLTRAANGGEWRVANIIYPESDLATLLRQLAADRQRKR